jgi:hypothetical protein
VPLPPHPADLFSLLLLLPRVLKIHVLVWRYHRPRRLNPETMAGLANLSCDRPRWRASRHCLRPAPRITESLRPQRYQPSGYQQWRSLGAPGKMHCSSCITLILRVAPESCFGCSAREAAIEHASLSKASPLASERLDNFIRPWQLARLARFRRPSLPYLRSLDSTASSPASA